MSVITTKSEALAAADRAERENEAYLARLDAEGTSGLALAKELRNRLATFRSASEAFPSGAIATKIWMVPLEREHSTGSSGLGLTTAHAGGFNGFGVYTYFQPSSAGNPAGYVQNFFSNFPATPAASASASSINSDLLSPAANPRWWDGGGATEYIYNCVEGACTWISPAYNVQIFDDPCLNPYLVTSANPPMICPGPNPVQDQYPRKHSRLYESQAVAADGGFWTLGDSHHDNMGHNCVDDWDHTREVLVQSIPPEHVVVTSHGNAGNAASTPTGTNIPPECSTHDGLLADVWLV